MTSVLLVGKGHNFDELGPLMADALAEEFDVTTTTDWDALLAENLAAHDAVVDYIVDYHAEMTDDQRAGLVSFVRDGGGYVGVHGAAAFFGAPEGADPDLYEEHREMLGGRLVDHPGVLETTTEVVADHPITEGLADFSFVDEPYELDYDADAVDVLAVTRHESFDGGTAPALWTKTYGEGRVVYYAAGHDERSVGDPNFQRILRRSVSWALDAA